MEHRSSIMVLIPAYKPDERLVTLCGELRAQGIGVIVVDDGGGEAYLSIFEQVRALGCHVERHAVNLGKGRALKTGINAALNTYENLRGLVTADCDGQHTCGDILRIMDAMREYPDTLVMGTRAFTGNVPFKSRAGNAITRFVYRFVTGIRCHDTQTGLRGLPVEKLGQMLQLPGERYEYEMTMLLRLREMELPLQEVAIETIYIDDNKGSHFNPLRDAVRIYAVIFKFLLSSVLSFGLDFLLYLFGLHVLHLSHGISYVLARAFSSLLNYALNRMAVFGSRGGDLSIVRYYMLAITQMAVGAGLVELFHAALGLSGGWIKIPVDMLLFFLSYVIQRDFVFGNRWRGRKEKKMEEKD